MSTTAVRQRARPMSPDERRTALVDATLNLLREHGRAVTTRQIAEAAGVAEGTIFRVFDSKDDLVDAAITQAFAADQLERRLAEIDLARPLRDRLLQLTSVLQQRYRATFHLMGKVGLVRPPAHVHDGHSADGLRGRVDRLMIEVVGPDAAQLGVPVEDFVHTLRLLTFAGSHPHISDGRVLSPEQIVDTLLHGMLTPQGRA